MVTKRGKRGDWPCQSLGRGRLSADERLQVEGLLEHVVYRLEGKGSDRFVSFSSMLRRGVTMETVASALMLRRGKTFAAGIETPGYIPQVIAKGDNVRAVRLMQLLQWEPKSPAYLRTTLGIASREYFTKAYLRPLMETGLIERSDPVHPNSPQQKYALTKDGRRRIERVAPL